MKQETLHYRGLGVCPKLFKKIQRIAKEEKRKVNPMIGILLEEAVKERESLTKQRKVCEEHGAFNND